MLSEKIKRVMWFRIPGSNKVTPTEGVHIVTLKTSSAEGEPIENMDEYGSYQVSVIDYDDPQHGTSSNFFINGNLERGGSVFRASTVAGKYNEHLTINWMQGMKPHLCYMNSPRAENGTIPETKRYKVVWRR